MYKFCMFVVSMQSPEGAEAKDATKVTKHEVIKIYFFFKCKTANSTDVKIIFYVHQNNVFPSYSPLGGQSVFPQ